MRKKRLGCQVRRCDGGVSVDDHPLGATGRLIDPLRLLSARDLKAIQFALGPVLSDCQAEFIVTLVDSVPGRKFREHAMASRRKLARDQTTSLILVIAVKDRHAEIATAPQFADRFTPAASTALLKAGLVPLMRRGRIADAIVSAVTGMRELLRRVDGREATALAWSRARGPQRRRAFSPGVFLLVIPAIFLAIMVFGPIQSCRQEHACRYCGKWCSITTKELKTATYSATGLSRRHYVCTGCGTNYSYTVVLPVLSASSDSSSWSSDSSSSGSDSSSSGSDSSSGGSDGGGGADW